MKRIAFLILLLNYFLNSFGQNFNYDLIFQRLDLSVNPAMRYITGKVDYFFKDADSLVSVDLSSALTVDSIVYHGSAADFTHQNDLINVNLHFLPSPVDSFTIYYHGEPPQTGMGSFTVAHHGDNVPVMWTLSEPYGARDWFPTKNNLGDKIDSLEVIIRTDPVYRAASNGLLIQDTVINGTRIMRWKTHYPIASYLVAFAVTNYVVYYDYANVGDTLQVPVMNMVYPEDEATARASTPYAARCLEFYSEKFKPYPFYKEKYGHAEFGWGGGMEHQTMTFVGGFGQSLLAHELAHQWFGDYITCGSWHEIYLNEAFATYLEGLTAEAGIADYSFDSWLRTARNRVLSLDTGSVYVQDTANVNRVFSYSLTYLKGALFLHLLRWTVGDSAFFQGLRNYLNDTTLSFGYAHTRDLKYHLEQACGCDLTTIFDQWLYGQGFPSYDITWTQKNDSLFVDINQQAHSPDINVFKLKLPLLLHTTSYDTLLTVQDTLPEQSFAFAMRDKVLSVIFDPDMWIPATATVENKPAVDMTRLYPNPVTDLITVELYNPRQVVSVKLWDINGKMLKSFSQPLSDKLIIDFSGLRTGVYILSVEYEDLGQTFKIIKL